MKKSGKISLEEQKGILKLYMSGKSIRAISDITGRSANAVYKHIRAAGLIRAHNRTQSKEFEPLPVFFAEKPKPKSIQVMINGKNWLDVTEFFIP